MSAFDFIVLGAGSAGCVLANRLSQNPSHRVCLVEGGPSDRATSVAWRVNMPVGASQLLPHARFNWQDRFTGDAHSNPDMTCPRGRLFGGSSAVNGMIYIRGQREDYDDWAALGNTGWSYDDVLPVFARHENQERGADAFHGQGGELNVADLRTFNPLSQAFVDGANSLQIRTNRDFNGAAQDGVGPYQVTQRGGERWSSARAFLHPALGRPNLTVLADTRVLRIEIDGGRAVAVHVARGGVQQRLAATREIVLSAGAVSSPQILMLSGIGPGERLRDLGIAVERDLPGVGENLQDHPTIGVWAREGTAESYALTARSLPKMTWAAMQYLVARKGRLTSNIIEAGGFVRTRPEFERPDLQFHFVSALGDPKSYIPRQHGVRLLSTILRPQSRGRVALTSASPHERPQLHARFLDNDSDVQCLLAGVKLSRRILGTAAFDRFALSEMKPGAAVIDDDALIAYIRANLGTAFHPTSTVKMGPDSDRQAAVDPRLRVRGIDGLRVADASIMPIIVSGNTNAPSIMIGERCADFILAEAKD